jgi:LmbE family N-acetylglucosaminyl deacetylase
MHLIESDYLPFSAGDPPPGPWLVLAPHPDDETFGMGGSIFRAASAGVLVDLIVLTDGALGGPSDGTLVARREQEARDACEILGVHDVEFWREPDRGLEPATRLIDRLAQTLGSRRPGSLFFPSLTEPHPDHRATALIGWEALRRTSFSARPVAYEISSQGPINLLLDISDAVPHKSRAMGVYASQEAERPYSRRILAQNAARTWSLPDSVSHAEAFLTLEPCDQPLDRAVRSVFELYLRGLTADGQTDVSLEHDDVSPPSSDTERALHALAAELEHIRSSRSWKLTAPYRWVGRIIRPLISR